MMDAETTARLDERIKRLEEDRIRQNGTLLRFEDKLDSMDIRLNTKVDRLFDQVNALALHQSERASDHAATQAENTISRSFLFLVTGLSAFTSAAIAFALHFIH